jgi:hypothetical protein
MKPNKKETLNEDGSNIKSYPIITETFTGIWPSLESRCSVSSTSKPELVVFSEA